MLGPESQYWTARARDRGRKRGRERRTLVIITITRAIIASSINDKQIFFSQKQREIKREREGGINDRKKTGTIPNNETKEMRRKRERERK